MKTYMCKLGEITTRLEEINPRSLKLDIFNDINNLDPVDTINYAGLELVLYRDNYDAFFKKTSKSYGIKYNAAEYDNVKDEINAVLNELVDLSTKILNP